MRYPCILVLLLMICTGTCFSQTSLDDALRQMEAQRRETELEIERARIRSLQFDADMARMRADTERMRAENAAQAAADRAKQAAAQQAEIARRATEKAEEEASNLRDEITRAGVKTRNSFYLVGLAAVFVGFGTFVIKTGRRGLPMKENEKFGLVAVIISFLLALLSLMMSANWAYTLDLLSNLMITLQIQLFADEDKRGEFLIDFPTKYLVLACISSAAYGVTTYLGITPVPWRKNARGHQESKELAIKRD